MRFALILLLLTTAGCGFDRSVCVPVSEEKLRSITQALIEPGSASLRDGFAVALDSTWTFVSARVVAGPDSTRQVGTWLVTTLEPYSGTTRNVNPVADRFTRWPTIRASPLAQLVRASEAETSRQCVLTAR